MLLSGVGRVKLGGRGRGRGRRKGGRGWGCRECNAMGGFWKEELEREAAVESCGMKVTLIQGELNKVGERRWIVCSSPLLESSGPSLALRVHQVCDEDRCETRSVSGVPCARARAVNKPAATPRITTLSVSRG